MPYSPFRSPARLIFCWAFALLLGLTQPLATVADAQEATEQPFQIPATDAVRRISWSPDGSMIAVGSGFQFCSSNPDHLNTFPVDILDASTGQLIKSLVGNHCYTYSVDWSPDSTKVVGTTIEPIGMRIWDVANGLVIVEGQMPVQGFIMARWNPQHENWIAINTIGTEIAVLDSTTGQLLNALNFSSTSLDWRMAINLSLVMLIQIKIKLMCLM